MSTTPTTSPPPATLAEILADTNTDLEYTIGVKDLPSMPLQVPPKSIEPSCNTHTPVLDVKEAPVLAESTPKVLTAAEQQRKKEMEALDAQTLKHEQDMKAKKAKEVRVPISPSLLTPNPFSPSQFPKSEYEESSVC